MITVNQPLISWNMSVMGELSEWVSVIAPAIAEKNVQCISIKPCCVAKKSVVKSCS